MNATPVLSTRQSLRPTLPRFDSEAVSDLIPLLRTIIARVAAEFRGRDLSQIEERRHFLVTVDRALLDAEPSASVVPSAVREELVVRLLRTCGRPRPS